MTNDPGRGGNQIGPVHALATDTLHRAALSTAHHAVDAADCAELLAALGLRLSGWRRAHRAWKRTRGAGR